MTDPLSVAAGVAGLVTLGLQITEGFTQYYRAYRDRDENIQNTLTKLDTLACCLTHLEKTVTIANISAEEDEVSRMIHKRVKSCEELLNKLASKLKSFQDTISTLDDKAQPRRKRIRLIYPFQTATLLHLEGEVDRIQQYLSFALDTLQIQHQKQNQRSIECVKHVLETVSGDANFAQLTAWLSAPEVTIDHNAARAKHVDKTGIWFVKSASFSTWLETPSSFLLVLGSAGSGKSVLCSTAIEHTLKYKQKLPHTGLAFFYFDSKDTTKWNVSGVLRSLISQLSRQIPTAYKSLKDLYEMYRFSAPPIDAVLDCLKRNMCCFEHVYIFLDALDQCPRMQERTTLLDTLNRIRGWNLPGLHLVVTSRYEVGIRNAFRTTSIQKVIMNNYAVNQDVSTYISYRLKKDRGLRKWRDHTAFIWDSLSSRACGMFLWAECQLDSLQDCPVSKLHLETNLEAVPAVLQVTYEHMLSQINDAWSEDARRILMLLCFAMEPLRPRQLIDALAVNVEHPAQLDVDRRLNSIDDVFQICPGIIQIDSPPNSGSRMNESSGEGNVRLIHHSLKEYLTRYTQRRTGLFAMNGDQANQEISHICLVHLHSPLELSANMSSFSGYAAMRWHEHYRSTNSTNLVIDDLSLDLLMDHGLYNRWRRFLCSDFVDHKPRPIYWTLAFGLDKLTEKMLVEERFPVQNDLKSSISVRQSPAMLCAAESRGDSQLARMLVEHGIEVDSGENEFFMQSSHVNGLGNRRYADIIKLLIRAGAATDEQKTSGSAFRLFKLVEEHLNAIHMLIDEGITTCFVNEYTHGRAIYLAAATMNVDLLRFLLGGNTEEDQTELPLSTSFLMGFPGAVQTPVRSGVSESPADVWQETVLAVASECGQAQIIRHLVESGADVDSRGTGEVLYQASIHGQLSVVQYLLDKGAKVDLGCKSALMGAINFCHGEVAQHLIDAGADIYRKTDYGDDALSAAAATGQIEVVNHLIRAGADVNAGDGLALRHASQNNYREVVQALLDAGALPTPWQGENHHPYGEPSRARRYRQIRMRRSRLDDHQP